MEYQNILLGDSPYFVSCVHASYPMHCHNETELLYCIKGNMKVIIENKTYCLTEGSILFVSALEMHQIIINTDSIAFVLEFGSQFLGERYDEFAIKNFSSPLINPQDSCPYRNRFEKPLKRLYSEYIKRKDGYTWAIQGLLYELFAMTVRYIPMEQNTEKQKKMSRYLKIEKVFNLIHEKYSEKITVVDAAAYVGYEPRSFCRLFKFITNETFHDYLNFYRINIAMQLLQHRQYPISEIALMVGIPVAKTFSRLFRKYTQMSPSRYRNRYLTTPETQV